MKLFIASIAMTAVLTLLLGLAYPFAITGIAQLCFPHQANGSMIQVKGHDAGSMLIAQGFSDARHFHARPSAAGDGYDPMKSGGSNLGPTSKQLRDRVKHDIDSLRLLNPSLSTSIPIDMVTASGSGLDPDITVANAMYQAPSVAKALSVDANAIRALVEAHIHRRTLGFLGEETINVLELNLAIDSLYPIARK